MSIIAALCSAKTGSTWIASDTMVCSGNLRQIVGPKWVVRRPWAAGIAGHLRTINVLQHQAADLLDNLADAYEFAHRAREILKTDGYNSVKNDGGPPDYGQMLILARPGGVWAIAPEFSVMPVAADRLWAEGSGRELALGAAHALLAVDAGLAEQDLVRHAVDAAIAYDSACGGSLWMEELVD